jgi:hypothetical protein
MVFEANFNNGSRCGPTFLGFMLNVDIPGSSLSSKFDPEASAFSSLIADSNEEECEERAGSNQE